MKRDEIVAELTLVLFYLNSWTENRRGAPQGPETRQAWKSADWDAIDTLRDANLIWCSNKAQSLTISEEGVKCAELLLEAYGLNDLLKDDARPSYLVSPKCEPETDEQENSELEATESEETKTIPGESETSLQLETVIEAIESTSFDSRAFFNTETGELFYLYDDVSTLDQDEDAPDIESDEWIALPDSDDVKDLQWMRSFARDQPFPLDEKLLDAAYSRHPYRMFKDIACKLGVLESWFAYRDERIREVAIAWFEANRLTPAKTTAKAPSHSMPLRNK